MKRAQGLKEIAIRVSWISEKSQSRRVAVRGKWEHYNLKVAFSR